MGKKSRQGYTEPTGGIKIKQIIKPRSKNQERYWESLQRYTITIASGPAGTGKTYLAVGAALKSLTEGEVNKIIITRPVIESGEKLGFLPGGLEAKMDPYIKPIMDSLVEFVGGRSTRQLFENYTVEVCPLAYMRGRTFKNAFIIADEMSSSNPEQMKNLLTRLGSGSRMVVIGDSTQTDLPIGKQNGLSHLLHLLKKYGEKPDGFNLIKLGHEDIIRHPLIYTVLDLYGEIHGNFYPEITSVESRISTKK